MPPAAANGLGVGVTDSTTPEPVRYANGWFMSFAGNLTFANAQPLREAARLAPSDLVVAETDSPFLSPHPYRGRPNRPGRVAVTAQTVAEVHGVPVERVAERTTATAAEAFGLALDGRG